MECLHWHCPLGTMQAEPVIFGIRYGTVHTCSTAGICSATGTPVNYILRMRLLSLPAAAAGLPAFGKRKASKTRLRAAVSSSSSSSLPAASAIAVGRPCVARSTDLCGWLAGEARCSAACRFACLRGGLCIGIGIGMACVCVCVAAASGPSAVAAQAGPTACCCDPATASVAAASASCAGLS